jgi:uncharacterized protein
MNDFDVRSLAALPREPWRNGGGVTRTLAACGDAWRVSLAEVERNGPYSRFAGMTRVSCVLRGQGVTLRDGDREVTLAPFEAVEYDGDAIWEARLTDGPVTALNVMSVRGRHAVHVSMVSEPALVRPACVALVLAFEGACRYGLADEGERQCLEAGEFLALANAALPLRIAPASPGARLVLVTIEDAA